MILQPSSSIECITWQRLPPFPVPIVPRAFAIFRLLLFFGDTKREPLRRREPIPDDIFKAYDEDKMTSDPHLHIFA